MRRYTGRFKKKLRSELDLYFPDWFGEADLNYLEKLKKYIQARIEYELTGNEDLLPALIKFRDYFLEQGAPKSFNPFNNENELVRSDQQFEAMCAALEENGVKDAKEMTVFEFYSRCKYFEKKSKK